MRITNPLAASLLPIAVLLLFAGCQKDVLPPNMVPVADAGTPQVVTLPDNTVTLAGSGTDSDGDVVAYLWSQVSGPAASVITNPGATSTLVTFASDVDGKYVFQLMVTDDKGATGVDTVSAQVNPNPIKVASLQPANNPGEIQLGVYGSQYVKITDAPDILAAAWTSSSDPVFIREVLKFDLSGIPSTATILDAKLYLYSYPSPTPHGNFVDANFGTSNTLLIQRITGDWAANTISWTNQPATVTTDQVVAANTAQSMLDLTLDVKNMVGEMIKPNANKGFMMKLQTEVAYNIRQFISSNSTTYADKRPKLVVTYQ